MGIALSSYLAETSDPLAFAQNLKMVQQPGYPVQSVGSDLVVGVVLASLAGVAEPRLLDLIRCLIDSVLMMLALRGLDSLSLVHILSGPSVYLRVFHFHCHP